MELNQTHITAAGAPPFDIEAKPPAVHSGAVVSVSARAAAALKTDEVKAKIKDVVKQSHDITEVVNLDGRTQAHRIGMVLTKLGTAIQANGKAAREDATAFSKAVIAQEDELLAMVKPEKERVLALRDAFDDKVRMEEEARAKAEKDRVERIEDALNSMRAELLWASGKSAQHIADRVDAIRTQDMSAEFWQEYTARAAEVHADVVSQLELTHAAQLGIEQEVARIKAEQEAEADRVAKQAMENLRIALALKQQEADLAERERQAAADRDAAAAIVAKEQARVQAELDAKLALLETQRKAFDDHQQALADKAAAEAAAETARQEQACAAEAAEAADLIAPTPVDESHLTVLLDRDSDLFGTASGIDTPEQAQAKNDRASAALAMLASMPPVEVSGFDLAPDNADQSVRWTLPPDSSLVFNADASISALPLSFAYDEIADVLTVEGINYAGDLFRQLGGLLVPDAMFKLTAREDGVLTIYKEGAA